MISVEGLSLNFNGRTIFSDFSLSVAKGRKAVLRGPSGTGKTTLLNVIMGFQKPQTGLVKINGTTLNCKTIHKIRHNFAWLPQNFNVFKAADVLSSIMLPFSFSENVRNKPDKDSIVSALSRLNLNQDILNTTIDNISGGEKQRIGIIICRLLKKPLLLLDEPTSALDKDSKARVIDYIMEDKELTVLSTSHDDEWVNACDVIIDINNSLIPNNK